MPPPSVLVFAGLDPTGGAGLAADIEALAANGCAPCPIATALTVQTSADALRVEAVAAELIRAQAEALRQDIEIAAIKVGLLPDSQVIQAVAEIAATLPHIPLVLDPVLNAGGGASLTREDSPAKLLEVLVPRASLVTPNGDELSRLSGEEDSAAGAAALIALGAGAVLVTGNIHRGQLCNRLYGPRGLEQELCWPRQSGEFHGTGCTLASALTAGLAKGLPLTKASQRAQAYTRDCIARAYRPGREGSGREQYFLRRVGD